MTRREFTVGALVSAAARAQNSPAQKRGRELIDDCIKALGGKKFLEMTDRLEVGRAYSFYRERLSGLSIARLYTRYAPVPNPTPVSFYGLYEKQAYGKKQDSSVLFVPDGAFEITFRGVRPLPDDTVTKHREGVVTNFLYILRERLQEPGLSFESRGVEVVDNQRAEAVEILDNAGRQITVYLGLENRLPIMQRYMRLDPTYKERIEEIMRFSKWHQSGGIQWPLDFGRERDGEKIYQMFAETFSINNGFDPAIFKLPADMPILKKENF